MTQAFGQVRPPSGRVSALNKLRAAGEDFILRWRAGLARRDAALRQVEAAFTLVVFISVFVVGYLWDEAGARWALNLPPYVMSIFQIITRLGDSAYIFVLSALVAIGAILARGRGADGRVDATLGLLASRAAFIFAATLVSGLFSQILKHLFGRARPSLIDVVGPFHFDPFSISARFASLPSGHTVTAFTVTLALGWFAPRWRIPLFALAALVGLSRVGVGAHYPSDVLAGAALGLGSTLLMRRMFGLRRIAFVPVGRGFVARRGRPMLRAIARVPIAS
jgi:membrane-associated phospholipid phosphatase